MKRAFSIGAIIVACVVLIGIFVIQKTNLTKQGYCAEFGKEWLQLSEPESGLSFCYKEDWKPEIENRNENGTQGTKTYMYTKSLGVLIAIESKDFKPVPDGGSDVTPINWKLVDPALSMTQIKKYFASYTGSGAWQPSITKVSINNKDAIFTSLKRNPNGDEPPFVSSDSWYLINALKDNNYNLHIVIDPDQISPQDEDIIIKSLRF